MNKKTCNICMLAMAVFMGLVTILANLLAEVYLLPALNAVLVPLVFIATLVLSYFSFKDTVSYENKWIWANIAISAWLALKNLGSLFLLLDAPKPSAVRIIALLLTTAGYAAAVAALLHNKFSKYLPYVFGALALGALFHAIYADFAVKSLVWLALYAALAVMTLNLLPQYNKYFRTAIVVLAVVGISGGSLLAVLNWIVFALILIPAGKWNIRLSFAKLVAVFYIISSVLAFVAFVDSHPFAVAKDCREQIVETKDTISDREETIVSTKLTLANYRLDNEATQVALQTAQTEFNDAEKNVQTAYEKLSAAQTNLSSVCRRTSYSTRYCSSNCAPLHTEVDNCTNTAALAEEEYYNAMEKLSDVSTKIEKLQKNIAQTEQKLEQLEKEVDSLNATLKDLRFKLPAERFTAMMATLAAVLCSAALIGLAVCFFKANYYGVPALVSYGVLALSAVVQLLLHSAKSIFFAVALPSQFLIIVICALFVVIAVKKEGKLAKYRVLIIIAAICYGILNHSAPGLAFAITAICAALVLVPPVFTEYNSISKHIFFTIISCGIWNLIWIYHVTRNLNKVDGVKTREPVAELLLSMFLPLYYSFWLLKTTEHTESYANETGVPCRLGALCQVFAFICPFISTILIQNQINMIVDAKE